MLDIVAFLLVGLLFSLFASQNSATTTVNVLSHTFVNAPTYLVVLISMIVGVLIASIVHFVNFLFTTFALFNKDAKIKNREQRIVELEKELQSLRSENSHLHHEPIHEDSTTKVHNFSS